MADCRSILPLLTMLWSAFAPSRMAAADFQAAWMAVGINVRVHTRTEHRHGSGLISVRSAMTNQNNDQKSEHRGLAVNISPFNEIRASSNSIYQLQTPEHRRKVSKLLINVYFREHNVDLMTKIKCEQRALPRLSVQTFDTRWWITEYQQSRHKVLYRTFRQFDASPFPRNGLFHRTIRLLTARSRRPSSQNFTSVHVHHLLIGLHLPSLAHLSTLHP